MAGQFRYVTPVEPQGATGLVARVYAQLANDFGMARMAVFLTLSPAEEVLAATWATLRESLLAGDEPRTAKEVVALGVSMANRCPFCVAAHTTLLHATGDHRLAETIAAGGTPADPRHAELLAWARTGRVAASVGAEHIGTALIFHFINRMASALLTENLLPGNLQNSRLVRSVGGRVMSRTVRRPLPPGASLPLVAGLPALPEPSWGAGTAAGAAYAVLRAVAGAGAHLLGEAARAAVTSAVAAWDGEHPPMGRAWLDGPLAGVPAAERPGAALALLAALAPYRVTDADVAAWRGSRPDEDLVRLCAFGAITATERMEAFITGRAAAAHAKPGGRS
ncbi:DNA-binding protein [Nonomuraea phyllanthi]|uniref:DNA-binding protein n=1 Tax=Nonomuraea phyllanthi TaxID=2219224 RepID=A0A5C4WUF1_9ACTN|nr:carboxymuconolactone decarboxylase family protein [Nonomuraea phyllanthi]KAB8196517.1 DNA-binding protein [Nonomuraea phyllanthi]